MPKLRKTRRTTAMAVATLAFAGGVAAAAAGSANAATAGPYWVQAVGPSHVGVYDQPAVGPKFGVPDLNPGDYAYIDCWVAGGSVGNAGDVWYHTTWTYYPTQGGFEDHVGNIGGGTSWTFAPYLDGAAAFHNNLVPNCNS